VTIDTAAQPYHRLYRTLAGYRWWRPLVALLLAVVYYLVLSIVVALPVLALAVFTGELSIADPYQAQADLERLAQLDAASPVSLLLALGSIAVMLPAVQLALLSTGLRPTGVRHSVSFRVRWRWLWLSSLPALVVVVAGVAVPIIIGVLFGEPVFGEFTTDPLLFAGCAAIILVLTPFQAAAEEYVFRGFFAQILGSWVRFAPVAIIVPSAIFAASHAYDATGIISVAIFGLAAAFVVWRTGGLEAGITYHALNNIAAFLFLATGMYGTTVNQPEVASDAAGAALVIVSTLIGTAIWVVWTLWLAKRNGIARLGGRIPDGVSVPADPAAFGNVLDQVPDAKEPAE
jgi:membrane protease YdiL (CAAX protease family)